MKYLEITAAAGSADTVAAIAEKAKAWDFRVGVAGPDGLQTMRMLVRDEQLQVALDALQNVLGAQPSARMVVLAVETALPKEEDPERSKGHGQRGGTPAREALYQEVSRSARLDGNYLVLVALSTVVAAIGLIEDNVAVVIGAMVIAPLLGPNLALSLGTALGDRTLVRKAIQTLFVGVLVAAGLSAVIGWLWTGGLTSAELSARTVAGLDSIALALASGAAAALSLTTGLSSVLVGVMVAVALLPPATTLGLMLGAGEVHLATGAGLLLAVNIASVNLASKVVFYLKGIRPRTWFEKEQARRAMGVYVAGWVVILVVLVAFIYLRAWAGVG